MEHTTAELDFVLEMGALDEPEKYTFLRGGRDPKQEKIDAMAAWHGKVVGKGLEDRMEKDGLMAAHRRAEAYRAAKAGTMIVPMITRGGKPIPDA